MYLYVCMHVYTHTYIHISLYICLIHQDNHLLSTTSACSLLSWNRLSKTTDDIFFWSDIQTKSRLNRCHLVRVWQGCQTFFWTIVLKITSIHLFSVLQGAKSVFLFVCLFFLFFFKLNQSQEKETMIDWWLIQYVLTTNMKRKKQTNKKRLTNHVLDSRFFHLDC